MVRIGCHVTVDAGIARLIRLHADALAPYLDWDPALAASALDVLDEEVDRYIAETDDREATQIGHEIARVLLRAALTMRADQQLNDVSVERVS